MAPTATAAPATTTTAPPTTTIAPTATVAPTTTDAPTTTIAPTTQSPTFTPTPSPTSESTTTSTFAVNLTFSGVRFNRSSLEANAHVFETSLCVHWNAAVAPAHLHPSKHLHLYDSSTLQETQVGSSQLPVQHVTFLRLFQASNRTHGSAHPAVGFDTADQGAAEAVIAISVTALRDSMPAVRTSLTTAAASASATNPSMQNITADTFNEDRQLGALQEVYPAAVMQASTCPSPCYTCYEGTAQRMDERCGSTQSPSHGYCSTSEGAAVQCTCNPGFIGSKYCAPSQPAESKSKSLVWWQEVLTIAGSAFTILLGIYSARQHLVTRLRKRHGRRGPLSMNDSDSNRGSGSDCHFDGRDRFTMAVLRGKIREPEKDEQAAAALVDVLRPLLRGSVDLNESLSSQGDEPEEQQEEGRRSWSVINDASLSPRQRADEVRSWTPHMVAARVRSIGAAFAPYAATMVENGVDGQMLAALDEADLVGDMGVKKVHAKKLLQLARGLDDAAAAEGSGGQGREERGQVQEQEQDQDRKQQQQQGTQRNLGGAEPEPAAAAAGWGALTASKLYPPG